MKTPMLYANEPARMPLAAPLRFSGLERILSQAARYLRLLWGASPAAGGGPDPWRQEPATAALAVSTSGGDLEGPSFLYPPFKPSYLVRPTTDPDDDPDQPDPPPTSGYRVAEPGHFDRLLQVLRNIFGGDPPGKGLKPWSD